MSATVPPYKATSILQATPIAGAPFGIEVQVDLAADPGPEEKEALRQLYRRDGLLLIRNQHLSMSEQIEACGIFGPVLRDALDNYLVSNVLGDGLLGNRELLFHNDIPYVPEPYLGGSLHALEVDPGVSPTRFASGFLAYDRLPAHLRDRIARLNALHVRERATGRRTRLSDSLPGDNCAVHAVVRRQEGTGRPYLFVNLDMTACVIGLSEHESDALLEELFSHLYAEDTIYDHLWQPGDIIIWDNLAVQHARREITAGTRTLQRVSIARFGYWDQYPADLPTYGELHNVAPSPT